MSIWLIAVAVIGGVVGGITATLWYLGRSIRSSIGKQFGW